MLRKAVEATGESQNFKKKYRGPMIVIDTVGHDTYKIVQLKHGEDGRTYSARAHVSQLKP